MLTRLYEPKLYHFSLLLSKYCIFFFEHASSGRSVIGPSGLGESEMCGGLWMVLVGGGVISLFFFFSSLREDIRFNFPISSDFSTRSLFTRSCCWLSLPESRLFGKTSFLACLLLPMVLRVLLSDAENRREKKKEKKK